MLEDVSVGKRRELAVRALAALVLLLVAKVGTPFIGANRLVAALACGTLPSVCEDIISATENAAK